MKIRYDFVTNSSSTSYIIISDGEFNLKTFLEATGVDKSSQFKDIYEGLFKAFQRSMEPVRKTYEEEGERDESFDVWLRHKFMYADEVLPKILEAEKLGKTVYFGRLRSDYDQVESFFCTDAFIIDHPKVYVDAREYGW